MSDPIYVGLPSGPEQWSTISDKRDQDRFLDYVATNIGDAGVVWNIGFGPRASYQGLITRIVSKALMHKYGNIDQIIQVQLSSTTSKDVSIEDQLAMVIAEKLKILDQEDGRFMKLKQVVDEERYYSYEMEPKWERKEHRDHLSQSIKEKIHKKFTAKKYLLVVEGLHSPIANLGNVGLPSPNQWNGIRLVISTNSQDVCTKSKLENYQILSFNDSFALFYLIPQALHDAAKSIFKAIRRENEECWHRIALRCLLYSLLFSSWDENKNTSADATPQMLNCCIGSDELIHRWVAEGLISTEKGREEDGEYKYMYEAGQVILEAFIEYSLLQRHSGPFASPSDTCITATSLLAEHVVQQLKVEELSLDEKKLKHDKWISFMDDRGMRIKTEWSLKSGLTTLILRGHSQISSFPFGDLSTKLTSLHVLDLSYTLIKSLPSSIAYLTDLRLLSLRGCRDLETLCPSTSTTSSLAFHSPLAALKSLQVLDMNGVPLLDITQEVGTHKSRLCHLDVSHSRISSLPSDFFVDMSSLRELILVSCSSLMDLPSSLTALSNLEAFHLTGTQVRSFPENTFDRMQRLQSLKLIDNKFLISIPGSLSRAQDLKVLHIHGCEALVEINMTSGHLSLRSFSLSGSPAMTHLSLRACTKLEFVNLRDLAALEELDTSEELKELHLHGCEAMVEIKMRGHPSLRSFSLSRSPITNLSLHACRKLEFVNLQDLAALEELDTSEELKELHLHGCEAMVEIKMRGHPSLRSFSLSGSPAMTHLSLHACRKLEFVNLQDLAALEELNLSATAIKEFPSDIANLPRLRRLHLLGVPCLRRFPWHQLVRFPEIFSFDQCETAAKEEKHHPVETSDGARIYITDSRFFYSFNDESKKFLRSFYVCVSPCTVRSNKELHTEGAAQGIKFQEVLKHSPYKDVCCSKTVVVVPMVNPRPSGRHVEISATDRYPHGLTTLLAVTKSISITDDAFISSLSELNTEFGDLQECQLQRCHQMEAVFVRNHKVQGYNLQNIWVSHLRKLSIVFQASSSVFYYCEFRSLKQVHLEHCPRLEKIFPWSLELGSLETITIMFCPNLKTIFYKSSLEEETTKPSRYPLRHLKTMRLLELPQLQHLHDKKQHQLEMPAWEELHIRGCQSLQRLPLLARSHERKVVCVDGERDWWSKLQWEGEQRNYFKPKLPPEFACFDDNAMIKSYLT